MSGIQQSAAPITPMAQAAALSPEQQLKQKIQNLSGRVQQANLELEEAERTASSLRQQKRELVLELQGLQQQLDMMYIKDDPELTRLLALKLPDIVRGIQCKQDLQNQKLLIQLLYCEYENAKRVNEFFCAFLNDEDFLVESKIGTFNEGPFNNPYILITASLSDREKLVTGLTLATPKHNISSTTLTARC